MGLQSLTTGTRSNLTPQGFEPLTKSSRSNSPSNGVPTSDYGSQEQSVEPLTKSSRSNSPTNCTLWRHPMSMAYLYDVFEHLLRLWTGIWLPHSHHYHHRHFPIFVRVGLKSYLLQVCKPCRYTLVEAVEPFKLCSMSMAYLYEVFECLCRMWMGIWLHTHTGTTTDASPDLGKLAEILPYASVQTMPLHFNWGCRTFQTAFHVHVIHIWGVWVPSKVVDGHMASHSHHYHHTMDQSIKAEEMC